MWYNIRNRIASVKPSKIFVIKLIPWLISLALLILTISLGAAPPGSTPPGPG